MKIGKNNFILTIEKLSKQNLERLTELTLEFWREYDYEEELKNWETVLNSTNEICYLAKNEENYIGFAHLTIRNDYVEGATESPMAYIEPMYVKPNYQRFGIGKRLLKAGENWATQKGCNQLASDTELNNSKAIAFHEEVGFEEVNRVVCFVKNLKESV